jgi:hypothetical protein
MQCKFLPHLAIAMILLLQSCSKVSEKTSGQTSPVQMVSSPAGTNLSVDLATGYNTFQFISANGGLSPQVANFSLFDGGLSETMPAVNLPPHTPTRANKYLYRVTPTPLPAAPSFGR